MGEDQLRIRRFNNSFTKFVDLQSTDLGRSIKSFALVLHPMDHDRPLLDMEADASEEDAEFKREILMRDGSLLPVRTRRYSTEWEETDVGVAVTILELPEPEFLGRTDRVSKRRILSLESSKSCHGFFADFGIEGQ